MNRTIITQSFILTPSNLWFLGAFEKYLFSTLILTIISEKHHTRDGKNDGKMLYLGAIFKVPNLKG